MLKDKLLQWKYYKDKIPMYLQNSFGFQEHYKMFFDFLVSYDSECDKLLQAMNITNTGDLGTLNVTEVLDEFAELYGLSRKMVINGEELTFSDDELLKLIQVKIFQIYYNGTRKSFLDFYNRYFHEIGYLELNFYVDKYYPNKIVVTENIKVDRFPNLKKAYLYTNLLFVDIMGTEYERREDFDTSYLAKFDDNTKLFDSYEARFL